MQEGQWAVGQGEIKSHSVAVGWEFTSFDLHYYTKHPIHS